MNGVAPKTIDDLIERLQELKVQHGNLEVRRYEGRYGSMRKALVSSVVRTQGPRLLAFVMPATS
jgi:hypothetical protein